jgi:hypothetical protein
MNSYFILSLVSLLSAIAIVALKVCYASKCENVSLCWGFILVEREVNLENKELQSEISMRTFPIETKQMKILRNNLEEDQHLGSHV